MLSFKMDASWAEFAVGWELWTFPMGQSMTDHSSICAIQYAYQCFSIYRCRYEGEFMQGWFHGMGQFIRSDGMKFEGEFRGGRIWGLGLATFSDLTNGFPRNEGFFQDCKLIRKKNCPDIVQRAQKVALMARIQCEQPNWLIELDFSLLRALYNYHVANKLWSFPWVHTSMLRRSQGQRRCWKKTIPVRAFNSRMYVAQCDNSI